MVIMSRHSTMVGHETIPQELINSLGENATALGPDYLKLPMKRAGGNFELR